MLFSCSVYYTMPQLPHAVLFYWMIMSEKNIITIQKQQFIVTNNNVCAWYRHQQDRLLPSTRRVYSYYSTTLGAALSVVLQWAVSVVPAVVASCNAGCDENNYYYTHKRGTSTAGPKIGTKARASISAAIHNYLGRQFVCENHALSWAWLTYYDRQCTPHHR